MSKILTHINGSDSGGCLTKVPFHALGLCLKKSCEHARYRYHMYIIFTCHQEEKQPYYSVPIGLFAVNQCCYYFLAWFVLCAYFYNLQFYQSYIRLRSADGL